MEHTFREPRYSVGVEEELMIVEPSSMDLANAIEDMLTDPPQGQIKPELLECVLEIATEPCPDVPTAARELRNLRSSVRDHATSKELMIGSAGTHPFARWEQQRIVRDDRYRNLVSSLGFVARQELVFGMHVHVGVADPEEAIYVVNGLRPQVALLVALAANSPLWRGEATGLMSTRVPIFRTFPRVGVPPRFADWPDYVRRVSFMVDAGMIEDYTFLWYDVRPHPRFGTVEVRAMDSQTRVEHTVALTALIQSMVKELCETFGNAEPSPDPEYEILDENKWLAARHGLDAELLDLATRTRRPVRELGRELVSRVRPHAQELGCEAELEGVLEMIDKGNGALRQRMVFEANHDLRELMAEIVSATA